MDRPIRKCNTKRRISEQTFSGKTPKYVGVGYHKQHPEHFGLRHEHPRPDKTLCDQAGKFTQKIAQELLCKGAAYGLVSIQMRGEWPQNIWAVSSEGIALEAMLDQKECGTYHGYPMNDRDPLREDVLEIWKRHDQK